MDRVGETCLASGSAMVCGASWMEVEAFLVPALLETFGTLFRTCTLFRTSYVGGDRSLSLAKKSRFFDGNWPPSVVEGFTLIVACV